MAADLVKRKGLAPSRPASTELLIPVQSRKVARESSGPSILHHLPKTFQAGVVWSLKVNGVAAKLESRPLVALERITSRGRPPAAYLPRWRPPWTPAPTNGWDNAKNEKRSVRVIEENLQGGSVLPYEQSFNTPRSSNLPQTYPRQLWAGLRNRKLR